MPRSRDSWPPRRRVPPHKSATLSRGDRVAAQERALSRPNVWPCHVCFWPFCQKLKTGREVPQTSSPRSISSINSNAFSILPLRLQRKLHWNSAARSCRDQSHSSPQSLGEVSGTVAHSFPQSPRATPRGLDSAHRHQQQQQQNIPNLNVVYDAGSLDTGSGGTRQVRGESVFLCVWGARLRDRGLATADVLLE